MIKLKGTVEQLHDYLKSWGVRVFITSRPNHSSQINETARKIGLPKFDDSAMISLESEGRINLCGEINGVGFNIKEGFLQVPLSGETENPFYLLFTHTPQLVRVDGIIKASTTKGGSARGEIIWDLE